MQIYLKILANYKEKSLPVLTFSSETQLMANFRILKNDYGGFMTWKFLQIYLKILGIYTNK